ncbi:hypothetical protein MTR67_021757, partial [Solanum verrucosum]
MSFDLRNYINVENQPKGKIHSLAKPNSIKERGLILNSSPQALSVVECVKQPIPLYDDSVTFDTLHLVARNLDRN